MDIARDIAGITSILEDELKPKSLGEIHDTICAEPSRP